MSENISESRFNMWRAVLALIHADGVVQQEERDFMNHYLAEIPFSAEQKDILISDLSDPQNVGQLFNEITDNEDRGQFFMFARMLIWCDGDLDAQEESIFERIMGAHMKGVDESFLREQVASSRDDARFKKLIEDDVFAHQAREKIGIVAIFKDWFAF